MSRAFPHRHRSAAFLLVFALANAGGVIGYLPLLTLLLPLKIEALAGPTRIGMFTATVVAGAVAASAANILFGWLSDRSVARGGGRRRWMAAGAGATVLAYAAVAAARSPVEIVAAVIGFQLAVNALLAPLFAIMADEIPDTQKGVAGGLLALAYPAASALSAALVGASLLGEEARLAIVPLVMAGCVTPLLLMRAKRSADEPATAATLPRRDLIVAGIARLCTQTASAVALTYLLYYFESITPASQALPARVGTLMTFAFALSSPIAVVLGRISDRTERRKPILVGAAAVSAAGLAGMAVADGWAGGAAAFCVYAIGSAVFAALHAAFAMQLLPQPGRRGRDLGLLNLANTLPSLLGPPLTWLLATPRDFAAVMLMLAALSLCGGLCVLPVRGRR